MDESQVFALCDQSDVEQLVKVLQGFSGGSSPLFVLQEALFATATATAAATAPFKPGRYHGNPNNAFLWGRNKTTVPANRFEAIRILITLLGLI